MPAPRQSRCATISAYFTMANAKNVYAKVVGFASSIPNIPFAATFSWGTGTVSTTPAQVTPAWFANLSPGAMTGVVFNGATTLVASGAFGVRYLGLAMSKMSEEYALYRQGKNTGRFIIETGMAFGAALTGGAIAGEAFSNEAAQWSARVVGFSVVFSLSFLGMCDLIISRTEDAIFVANLVDQLNRLSPAHQAEVRAMLQGNALTTENVKEFLTKVLDRARAIELQNEELQNGARNEIQEPQEPTPSVFREKTALELRSESRRKIGDYIISGSLTGCCSFLYIQSGFSGTNILALDHLSNLPNWGKMAIGIAPGLPLALFVFFTVKIFQSPLVGMYPEIKDDLNKMLKAAALVGVNVGNSTWYYGLAALTANSENIFYFLLKSSFGQIVFPWAAFLASLVMGVNGLTPMVFPPAEINMQQPELTDVIKAIKNGMIPAEVLQGFKKHAFFTKERPSIRIEVQEAKQDQALVTKQTEIARLG